MASRVKKDGLKHIKGLCFGCAHADPKKVHPGVPGTSRVCGLCLRNPDELSKDAARTSDQGNIVYGLRDCYIATDRLEMELRGETFFTGGKDDEQDARGKWKA